MTEPLRQRASGKWSAILQEIGIPAHHLTGKHTPCPMCGGKDRFRFDNKLGNGTWICRCGAGDGVQLVMAHLKSDFKTAANEIEQVMGSNVIRLRTDKVTTTTDQETNRKKAVTLWEKAKPIQPGDPAWLYLGSRGIEPGRDQIAALRYHPSVGYNVEGKFSRHPAMLAAVTDASGDIATVLRTYLTKEGQKAPVEAAKKLMAGGMPSGGAIRLRKPAEVLGIAEGLETAISAEILHGVPCWSAVNGAGLKAWEPPIVTRHVVVFADNDDAGIKVAQMLCERLTATGRSCEIKMPPISGTDWNDILLQGDA